MGEARRRRLAREAVAYRDAETGQPVAVKWAGDPLDLFEETARRGVDHLAGRRPVSRVPCDGCRACCWHAGVDVDPNIERPEDLAHLDLVWRDEGENPGWFIRKRDDGACVHLGPGGCTVYEHRPTACRLYDCRVHALTGVLDSYDGGQHQPSWRFEPKTLRSRVSIAVWQMMGMAKATQQSGHLSAPEVATAVFADTDTFEKLAPGMMELAQASPDEQRRMLGFDPSLITPEQMQAGMRQMFGGRGTVMVRDKDTP